MGDDVTLGSLPAKIYTIANEASMLGTWEEVQRKGTGQEAQQMFSFQIFCL